MIGKISPDGVVKGKFKRDGSALAFEGNTVICHITSSAIYNKIIAFAEHLAAYNEKKDLYALLPPSSYHITLFDGACKKNEKEWYWPKDLPLTVSLSNCNEYIAEKIREKNVKSRKMSFQVKGVKSFINTLAITVHPTDESIHSLRNELANAIGIRRENHDSYVFHITLAYFLRKPSEEEQIWLAKSFEEFIASLTSAEKNIPVGLAEFCSFEDMTAFKPLMFF